MTAEFSPSRLSGKINIPPSKSVSHRAVICAALAEGKSRIENLMLSEDIKATIKLCEALGASVNIHKNTAEISGIASSSTAAFTKADCNESGSTLRFMLPLFCALGVPAEFTGKGKLPSRPITPYIEEFSKKGIEFDYSGCMPFTVKGKLAPGKFTIDGKISSQFVSGLMLSLPLLDGDSEVHIKGRLESKPYAVLTKDIQSCFGVYFKETDYGYFIPGGQKYTKADYFIEGDYSQAAFFLVAAAINGEITATGLKTDSKQGDMEILNILKSCGAHVSFDNGAVSVSRLRNKLSAFTVDIADIPDLAPILAVLACFCDGVSVLENTERLKIKESDRVYTTLSMINSLGGQAYEKDNRIVIEGGHDKLKGGRVNSFNDHRIAMATAVAALFCENKVLLEGAECVNKSYPAFFEDYKSVGGNVNVIGLEQRKG